MRNLTVQWCVGYTKQKGTHMACFPGAILLKDFWENTIFIVKNHTIKYLICKKVSEEGSHRTFSDFKPVALDWTSRLPGSILSCSGVIRATVWKRLRSSGLLSRKQQMHAKIKSEADDTSASRLWDCCRRDSSCDTHGPGRERRTAGAPLTT